MGNLFRSALALAVSVGCAASGPDAPAPSSAPDVAAPDTSAAVDADVGAPKGPPCQVNADCDGVFLSLGVCEQAACVADPESDQRYCRVEPVPVDGPCDDGDACTTGSRCDGLGGCVPSGIIECPDQTCQESLGCAPDDGTCRYAALADGTACDDGNPCTTGDACLGGACAAVYAPGLPGCSCERDADCPAPDDACAGEISCQDGACALVPAGGVQCDAAAGGSCRVVSCEGGGCLTGPAEDGAPCDDGNPCTTSDRCQAGTCAGGRNACACRADADCAQYGDDNLCNGALACIGGVCAVAPGSVPVCLPPDDPCLRAECQPSTGLCATVAVPDGVTCSDGDACTLGDACVQGVCTPAVAATCGPPSDCDGVPCAAACLGDLTCDPKTGCPPDAAWRLSGQPCNDGLLCATDDVCVEGFCAPGSTALTCDDGNPCTADSCDDALGCVTAPTQAPCDDGDPCTLGDFCAEGDCVGASEQPCDDGNPCTTGFCAAGSGCTFVFNTAPCEDGDPCTAGDRCQSGQCRPGDKVCPCNEDANCTVAGGGSCAGIWHCIANQCVLETTQAEDCGSDPGPCLESYCDPVSGTCKLQPRPSGTPCSDGDACTAFEICTGGECSQGEALGCDDGNPCTDDACEPTVGCVHTANTQVCDDGDECTVGDQCKGGQCTSLKSVCDCKVDSDCDQPLDHCMGAERCLGGVCVPDSATVVDCSPFDGPCVSSACDPETGTCAITPAPGGKPCFDGDACTAGDVCAGGTCVPGAPIPCDDGNPCTADVCSAAAGCQHAARTGACNDGNPCTTSDTCLGGLCAGGPSVCKEICGNGLDDDGNGKTDCADAQCSGVEGCDVCATAPFIQCGSAAIPGAVGDAAPGQVGVTGCGDGPFPERIYRFTTSTTSPVDITLLQGHDAYTLRVLTAGEGGGCDPASCKASGSWASFTAVAGKVYHVVVEKLFLGGPPSFSLVVTCAPACVPACGVVECGPDGCGGSCGTCDDGNPCTQDLCDSGACVSLPIEGCCASNAQCDDSDPCTSDQCLGGQCEHVGAPGCCTEDEHCDDGVACTEDLCDLGTCLSLPGPGCCVTAGDCDDDDACTTEICAAGRCHVSRVPGCCAEDAECLTGLPCRVDACLSGQCVSSPISGCCSAAAHCDDGDPCTHDACQVSSLTCQHLAIPGCCESPSDCPADPDPCTSPLCVDGTCTMGLVAGCCHADADCAAAGPCTEGRCVANQCTTAPTPGCCTAAGDCDDALACTLDACALGQCANLPLTTCCAGDDDCADGDPCTEDSCHSGACVLEQVAGCCAGDGECNDGDPCTADTCSGGTCQHQPIPSCCEDAFDCAAGACLTPTCVGNTCGWQPVPGCCDGDGDCVTGNQCVTGTCEAGACVLAPVAGCCLSDAECANTGGPCEAAHCEAGECVIEPLSECCTEDADCPLPSLPCREAACIGHACTELAVDGCCTTAADCRTPRSPCEKATCEGGSCGAATVPGCCVTAAECPAATDPCSRAVCVENACATEPEPGCCADASDCAPAGVCDVVECVLGECVVGKKIPGCCQGPADCPLPQQPCQQRSCVGHQCLVQTVPGCCASAGDCPAPASPCDRVWCDDGRCRTRSIEGCCAGSSDCSASGSPCAVVSCEGGACLAIPEPGCCAADQDCAALATEPCTRGVCSQGACVVIAEPDCCGGSEDCVDESCATGACLAGACRSVPQAGCCEADADCPEDPDPCSAARCAGGMCTWETLPGCCAEAADCPAMADPCSIATCVAGECVYDALAGCAAGACLWSGFDDGAGAWKLTASGATVGWDPVEGTAFSGDGSLEGSFPGSVAGGWMDAAAPGIVVQGGSTLRFRYRLELGVGDCSGGGLSVLASADGGAFTPLWETCLSTTGWRPATLDLSEFEGKTVVLKVRLKTSTGGLSGSAWLDDVAFSGDCELTCSGACDDGDSCTADQCVQGRCVPAAIPGCCEVDVSCADGDPCTTDACGPSGGCVNALAPGCTAGACAAFTLDEKGAGGWATSSTSPGLGFVPGLLGSLSEPGHLVATADAADVGQSAALILPPVVASSDSLVLRFALRQAVGVDCELGRLVATVGEAAIPLPCGFHDWLPVAAPLPVSAGDVADVSLRFDVEAAGAKVEIDDVRLSGACRPAECVAATDCDDGDPCTIDACDSGYACRHLPIPGCCESAADCPPAAGCAETVCDGGTCGVVEQPGCVSGACAYEGFEDFTAGDVAGATPGVIGWTTSAVEPWSGEASLRGFWQFGEEVPAERVTRIRTMRLFVGDGATVLRARYRATFPSSDCADGSVELRVGGVVVWVGCESTAGWKELSVPVGSWVGGVVDVSLRLWASATPGSWGEVTFDDLAGQGICEAVGCGVAADCDDGNPCTDEHCLGLDCVHLTNQLPCDDGDACTGLDRCLGATCEGDPKICDDGNPCTADSCAPLVGCVFQPHSGPCDDGDACTGGDACVAGSCQGTSLLCKDFNDCTRDGCTPGVGCAFEPEPFGAACAADDSAIGSCWDGLCVGWEHASTGEPGRLHGIAGRSTPVPLRVAGESDAGGVVHRVLQSPLGLSAEIAEPAGPLLAITGQLAVGGEGAVVGLSGESAPAIDLPAGLSLRAAFAGGSTTFLGGDGSAVAQVKSTLRRCKAADGAGQACQVMPVVHSPALCGKQQPFHVRGLWAASGQTLFVAGFSLTGADQIAGVAVWDGNTLSGCDPLGVYSGEVYIASGAALAVDHLGEARREAFHAIGGSGAANVWAAGTGGLIARYDGETWTEQRPEDWPDAAGWSPEHEVFALHVTPNEVHLAGDGAGVVTPGCRNGFYLHAARHGDTWVFDRLIHFPSVADCAVTPFDRAGLRGLTVDGLTGDLYLAGWTTDDPDGLTPAQPLLLRLQKP